MRGIAFVLVCLACTGHGRRIHMPAEHQDQTSQKVSSSLNSLARLVLVPDPTAGWQVPTVGHGHGLAESSLLNRKTKGSYTAREAGLPRMFSAKEALDRDIIEDTAARPGPQSEQQLDMHEAGYEQEGLLSPKVLASVLGTCALLGMAHSAAASGLTEAVKTDASDGGFVQAFLLIFASEIGDKTFFLAGLLAAKYSRLISLSGSVGALAVMTVISTALGQIFHAIPDGITNGIPFDDYVAIAAFTYFGGKTLYDAVQLEDGDDSGIEEEKKEAEEIVAKETSEEKRRDTLAAIAQTFGLVFAAEIGDRSFLSTIALSAALNPFAVSSGAILAHASATGLAVQGGAVMSKYLSEKVIGYIGGSLFLVFALTTALGVF